ncbi:MAG: outer membrane beta-barrel protein [Burkholderiaceae bacterium]
MKRFLSAALAAAAVMSSPAVLAQAYVGAGMGAAKTDFCDFDGCDNNAFGFKAFAGYKFNDYIALEGAYVNLGEFKAHGGGLTVKAKPQGAAAFVVAGLPVDQAWLYAKGGVSYFKTGLSADIPSVISLAEKDSATGAAWGFGASYPVWRGLSLRAEWERYRVSGETIDLIGGSLAWQF